MAKPRKIKVLSKFFLTNYGKTTINSIVVVYATKLTKKHPIKVRGGVQ